MAAHSLKQTQRKVGAQIPQLTDMQTLYNLIFLKLHTSRDRFSVCVAVPFIRFALESSDFFQFGVFCFEKNRVENHLHLVYENMCGM